MELSPKTIYVPISFDKSFYTKGRCLVATHEVNPMEDRRIPHAYLEEIHNQYILTKEQLMELLNNCFDGGFNESSSSFNGQYPSNALEDNAYIQAKKQFINSVFNQKTIPHDTIT